MKNMPQLFSKQQLLFKLGLSLIFQLLLVLFYSAWQNLWTLSIFAGAYFLGTIFLYLDEQYLYKYYEEKIDLTVHRDSHYPDLISRSFLFLLSLPLISIFVLTSSGSVFGIALVLALNFYLLVEMWQLRLEYLLFKDRFLEMVKIKATAKQVNQICVFALLYFIFLLLILIF